MQDVAESETPECSAKERMRENVNDQGRSVIGWPHVVAVTLLVFCTGSTGLAQRVIFTLDDLDKAMKTVGQTFGLVTSTVASKDFEAAKVQVARSRDQLARTISFWRNKEKEDAVKMVRDAVAKLDDLDNALSANTVDASAVIAAARQIGVACEACHAVYREQDPATKTFRLKPGQ
jgi:cytochrome c556